MLNTPLLEKKKNSRTRCGNSLYPQRFEISCGKLALIYSQYLQCRRRVLVDPTYTIYKQHDETVVHVLCECPFARNVWAMVRGRLQKCNSEASNFYTLARQMEEKLPKKELEIWTIVSWAIWNARNRFHFEEKQSMPNDILHGAMTLLQEYQELCKTSTST